MVLSTRDPRGVVAESLRVQARWCERLASPLYAMLLDRAVEDVEVGGPCWDVLQGHENDPPGTALALRFMGAVHRLVLSRTAPALAAFYPSTGGDSAREGAWPAFRETVAANLAFLRDLVDRPVQTNEVGRSAALLGGFLTVARETKLPLRVFEIGSSAGLNLRWDRYRYESGSWGWGDTISRVRFTDVFAAETPRSVDARVVERAGCDPAPVDPATEDGRLTLMSYTWPDQERRFALLREALAIAADVPAGVERADGPAWLAGRLAETKPGTATVVFHSIVTQYLGEDGRARLRATLDDAGVRADDTTPLAWLRLEPSRPDGGGRYLVSLTLWPGAGERLLAEAHPHGIPVRWLASA